MSKSRSTEASLAEPLSGSPEADQQFHHYHGNEIPWYVRLIWLGFWIFAIAYTIRWLFPAMREELFEKL